MNLRVVEFSSWNEDYIHEFIELKKKLQGHLPTYFAESLDDYRKFLSDDSPFSQDYSWQGFLVYQADKLVGKCLLTWRKDKGLANLGFIDWTNDIEVAKEMIASVETFCLKNELTEVKTPVDFNFFVKYRIKSQGQNEAYFGEPIYPDYYHELFQKTGFEVVGTWNTFAVKKYPTVMSFFKKRKLKNKRNQTGKKITIRLIKASDWDNEIKIVHRLFLESFKDMPEFESITLDQFKTVYNDFKYIIHPLSSFIVEQDGIPVGFSINYPDPLKVLKDAENRKLSIAGKILLLLKLRFNFKTFLIPYIGKTKGEDGQEIKGITVQLSHLLSLGILASGNTLLCYQSSDSPSKREIESQIVENYAEYVLYGKKLK